MKDGRVILGVEMGFFVEIQSLIFARVLMKDPRPEI